jgi:hypothetical protein
LLVILVDYCSGHVSCQKPDDFQNFEYDRQGF